MHSWRIQQWNCYFPLAVQTEDPPTKSFITIEIDLRKGKWRIAWKEKQKAEIREKWARKPLLKVLVFRFRILLLWKWWISKNATTKRFHKFIKSLCCCILISWKLKESSSVTKACQQRFFLNTHHPKKKKKKSHQMEGSFIVIWNLRMFASQMMEMAIYEEISLSNKFMVILLKGWLLFIQYFVILHIDWWTVAQNKDSTNPAR